MRKKMRVLASVGTARDIACEEWIDEAFLAGESLEVGRRDERIHERRR